MIGLALVALVFAVLILVWAWRWDHRIQPKAHRDLDDLRRPRIGL